MFAVYFKNYKGNWTFHSKHASETEAQKHLLKVVKTVALNGQATVQYV